MGAVAMDCWRKLGTPTSIATREEEQAVSTGTEGPLAPRKNESMNPFH